MRSYDERSWRAHCACVVESKSRSACKSRDVSLIWSADEDNSASRRIAEKPGFVTWSRVMYVSVETYGAEQPELPAGQRMGSL